MNVSPAWSQACICGRTFSVPRAYTCHTRSCPKAKKRLSSALQKAKEAFHANKRRKTEDAARREATETLGPLVAEPSLNEVNLRSHQQVSFFYLAVLSSLLIRVFLFTRLKIFLWTTKTLINL
jgi:hypothetical protein